MRCVKQIFLVRWSKLRVSIVCLGILLSSSTFAQAIHVTYTYNDVGQLVGASYDSGQNASFSYDAVGNITAASFAGGVSDWTLTVAVNGSGSVSFSPAGQPGSGNTRGYADGTAVTLTAAANAGAHFVSWTGDCSGTQATCQLTMTSDKNATAQFATNGGGTDYYSVGGTVTGLTGSGLSLQLNGNSHYAVGSGAFTFPTMLADGNAYTVTVATQPSGQTCSVTNASGTISGANVTDVAVQCVDSSGYLIGGYASGLTASGLVLGLNGTETVTLNGDGSFAFSSLLAPGAGYSVTVVSPPNGQTCSVANGSGVIADHDVANVAVVCADLPAQGYVVGGTVTGLGASPLVLQLSGGLTKTISANGAYAFAPVVATGETYQVSVWQQPTGQTCQVSNATGTMANADVSNVNVNCSATNGVIFADGFELSTGGNELIFADGFELGGGGPPTASCVAPPGLSRQTSGMIADPAGTVPLLNVDVTDFGRVFGYDFGVDTWTNTSWPAINGTTPKLYVHSGNYWAMAFTVPSNYPYYAGGSGPWGQLATSNMTAVTPGMSWSLSLSADCGDFDQAGSVQPACYVTTYPGSGPALYWGVLPTGTPPPAGLCGLHRGQTYYFNVAPGALGSNHANACSGPECTLNVTHSGNF